MTFDVENLKVTEGHKALAAYIKTETGKAPSAATVALVLTLAPEYRKSEAYLAEKAAKDKERADRAAAARAKKEARLEKALEQARKLAADLGLAIPAIEGEDAIETPVVEAAPEVVVTAPETVTVKAPAKRRTANNAATIAVVPDVADVSPEDAAEDTSAVVVIESEDAFEEIPDAAEGDDDFFDDSDAEDY